MEEVAWLAGGLPSSSLSLWPLRADPDNGWDSPALAAAEGGRLLEDVSVDLFLDVLVRALTAASDDRDCFLR